jgi:hypothetical protein
MLIDQGIEMAVKEKRLNTMAAQSLKIASNYFKVEIAMLLGSAVFTVIVVNDLLLDYRKAQAAGWQIFLIASLFGLVLLGGSTYSLLRAWHNYSLVSKLELDGQATEGTVTNRWVDTFEGRPFYRVSYRFQEDLEIWETITEDLFEELVEGRRVPIRFLQHDPSVSRLDYERISVI